MELTKLPEKNEKGLGALEKAKALIITSNDDFRRADEMAVVLKALEKEVDEAFDSHIENAYKTHKGLVGQKKSFSEPLVEARKVLKLKMSAWQEEQERIRQAEEAKLREQARKLEEDRRLSEAASLESAGDDEAAQALLDEPVIAAPVVLPKATPKLQTLIRKVWTFRVADPNRVPREYLLVDEVKLGQIARATKGTLQVPGVEFYEKVA